MTLVEHLQMSGRERIQFEIYSGGVSSQKQSHFKQATRSLATFVRSHRSLCLLAPQLAALTSLARSIHRLAHSLRSLPCGTVKFVNMCSRCKCVQWEQTRFGRSLETALTRGAFLRFFPCVTTHDTSLNVSSNV